MPLHTWLVFFIAAWMISLSPGPGALACIATGQRVGYRRGLWNIAGLQLGIITTLTICAIGLGAMLAASQLLFSSIKWLGVAYLIWLGIQQFLAPATPPQAAGQIPERRRQLVLRAFLINASNPKGIVFMLAVLPQFIDPALPQWPQYAICAATLVFTDLVVMSGYTLLAARMLHSLRDPRHIRWLNQGFGSLFVCAGLLLAGFRRG